MQAVTDRLKNFLQYVAVNLIDEPAPGAAQGGGAGAEAVAFQAGPREAGRGDAHRAERLHRLGDPQPV